MDFISHGLWGSIAFGRRNRRSFWPAFIFGSAPDVLSFGTHFAASIIGISDRISFSSPPNPAAIPMYVHALYNVTHSLVVAVAVIGIVWAVRRRPLWEMFAWPLHVLVDIPTHSTAFFPTPFLWPIAQVAINGKHWGSPWIFIPNVLLLVVLYSWFFIIKKRKEVQGN